MHIYIYIFFLIPDNHPASEKLPSFTDGEGVHEFSPLHLALIYVNPVYTLIYYSLVIHMNSIFHSESHKFTGLAVALYIYSAVNNLVM